MVNWLSVAYPWYIPEWNYLWCCTLHLHFLMFNFFHCLCSHANLTKHKRPVSKHYSSLAAYGTNCVDWFICLILFLWFGHWILDDEHGLQPTFTVTFIGSTWIGCVPCYRYVSEVRAALKRPAVVFNISSFQLFIYSIVQLVVIGHIAGVIVKWISRPSVVWW